MGNAWCLGEAWCFHFILLPSFFHVSPRFMDDEWNGLCICNFARIWYGLVFLWCSSGSCGFWILGYVNIRKLEVEDYLHSQMKLSRSALSLEVLHSLGYEGSEAESRVDKARIWPSGPLFS